MAPKLCVIERGRVRQREGREQVAEGRALVIGVEYINHAVARPGKRTAGRPDHQLVADYRERGPEFIAGFRVGVVKDSDELAVCVG